MTMTLNAVFLLLLQILTVTMVTGHTEQSFFEARKDLLDLRTYFDQKIKSIKENVIDTDDEVGCFSQDKTTVVFRALLKYPKNGQISSHAVIQFDNIVENEGSAYDKYRGMFTAPVKGIYDFSFAVREGGNYYLELALYKNNEQVGTAFDRQYNSVTLNIALRLDKGDLVYVKNPKAPISHFVGDNESFFTGHLVHQLQ